MGASDDLTVILGAGICGLSTAYHLERSGVTNYVVLEREFHVGGLARTISLDGFSFDHAIHILFSRKPYAVELICNELLAGSLRRTSRESYCYSSGVFTEYPYQANNFGLPPAVVVQNILGLVEAHYESNDEPPPHFEAWIYQTYGQGIAEHFMLPYNRRQWAWDLKEMNYDWIADRVPTPELRDVIEGALRPPSRKYGPNQEFWYPERGGIEALPRAFLRYLPAKRVWLGATAVAVDGRRREIVLADGRRVRYARLISTIPLPTLVELLGEVMTPEVRRRGAELKSNVVHTVNVGLLGTDLGAVDSMHWVYFPEEATIFHRLSVPRNFSPSMVPEGCSSIQLEISESQYRRLDRATLIEQSLEGLVRVGVLGERDTRPASDGGRVRTAQVLSLEPAYVIYDLGHRENTETIRSELQKLGITTSGRFGEWEYLNMDDALLSGKAAAETAG